MATFAARITALTGLTVSSGSASEYLKDAVLEITNMHVYTNPQDAIMYSRVSAASASQAGLSANNSKIISVVREAGVVNDWREATAIPVGMQARVTDPDSLSYSSEFNPTYIISDTGNVSVFPPPNASASSYKLYYVNDVPTDKTNGIVLVDTHVDIKYFPSDRVNLVVLSASIKALEAKLAEQAIDEEDQELVGALTPLLSILKDDYATQLGALMGAGKQQKGAQE